MKILQIFTLISVATILLLQPASASNSKYGTHIMTVDISHKYKEKTNAENVEKSEAEEGQTSPGAAYIMAEQTRYDILDTTSLLFKGREIAAGALPVPCKALLSFQILSSGSRNLTELKVLRVLPGATTAWSQLQAD